MNGIEFNRGELPKTPDRKVVVVHSGARDHYQVARALSEEGRLEALVTDLFWKPDSIAGKLAASIAPQKLRTQLEARSEAAIPSSSVHTCTAAGLLTLTLDKTKSAPFRLRSRMMRGNDVLLGATAGRMASRSGAALLSYSYYGHSAFSNFTGSGEKLLFQLHPHPASMRRILRAELEKHPDCAASLEQEWELALPPEDFSRLIEETQMPDAVIAASTFTRNTMVENGTPAEKIRVVPYGVDLRRFRPALSHGSLRRRLQLLFVGRINQRKGIKYLLEALRLLPGRHIELVICGRVLDDLKLFEPYRDRVTIRPSVSHAELAAAYQSADLFVFPSVAEGFGHVLLEAMACGLPILSTSATAAPDLIHEGVEGFVTAPGDTESLAARIDWALSNRLQLREMKGSARERAEHFTWERFRSRIREVVGEACGGTRVASSEAIAEVAK